MSGKIRTLLWVLAGVVAVVLAVATFRLAARARGQNILSQTVYVTAQRGAVGLRTEPDEDAPVVAALVRGSAVTIIEVSTQGTQTWYRIQKGSMKPGWVPADFVSRNPP
jgi:uncharacterized protein YgiM (DUF1202 family)